MGKRRKHGLSTTPEYRAIRNAIARCTNPEHQAWDNYGGRGIRVHEPWMCSESGPVLFLEHIGKRPGRGYELDRIDNDGHYEPGNVRWVKRKKNARNRRSNHLIEYDGRTRTLSGWAEEVGISAALLTYRIRSGWPMERALSLDAGEGNRQRPKMPRSNSYFVEHDGERHPLSVWAERTGIAHCTLWRRLKVYGWSVEDALETPVGQRRCSESAGRRRERDPLRGRFAD